MIYLVFIFLNFAQTSQALEIWKSCERAAQELNSEFFRIAYEVEALDIKNVPVQVFDEATTLDHYKLRMSPEHTCPKVAVKNMPETLQKTYQEIVHHKLDLEQSADQLFKEAMTYRQKIINEKARATLEAKRMSIIENERWLKN